MTKDFPDHTVQDRARAMGASVRCMWQMRGPKDTGVAWLECLQIGDHGDVVIVETFKHGGWNAFSAPHSNRVDDTLADVMERCGVKPKPVDGALTWYVFRYGTFIDTLGIHFGLKSVAEARDKYIALHPEIDAGAIKVSQYPPRFPADAERANALT